MSRKKRLIDVDELLKTIPPEETVSRIAVANAPTVDAIPVEYIKKIIELAKNSGHRRFAEHLGFLIGNWEKENAEID